VKFGELAEYYLKVEFGPEVTTSPKSENTKPILDHDVRDFLIAEWSDQIAEDIEPFEIQKWFNALHNKKEYGWTTHYLREWHKQTPYAKPTDFVFPSIKQSGRVPICASVFCADHLRPAAKTAGVTIPDGHRWGLHNLRQPVELAGEQSEGEPEDCAGHLGSFAGSDGVRPLH
jgi:hypothetical protein